MKKKEYIAPQMEVTEIDTVQMLAASAGDIPVVEGEGGEQLSNDRRGSWGNFWD